MNMVREEHKKTPEDNAEIPASQRLLEDKRIILDKELYEWQEHEKNKESEGKRLNREERALVARKWILLIFVLILMLIILWGWLKSFERNLAEWSGQKNEESGEWDKTKRRFQELIGEVKSNIKEAKNLDEKEKTSQSASAKPLLDTKDWLTLNSAEPSFMLKYPKSWSLEIDEQWMILTKQEEKEKDEDEEEDEEETAEDKEREKAGDATLSIYWDEIGQNMTIDEWLKAKGIAREQELTTENINGWQTTILPSKEPERCEDEYYTLQYDQILLFRFCSPDPTQKEQNGSYFQTILQTVTFQELERREDTSLE